MQSVWNCNNGRKRRIQGKMKRLLLKMMMRIRDCLDTWICGMMDRRPKRKCRNAEISESTGEYQLSDAVPQLKETDSRQVFSAIREGDIILAAMPVPAELLGQIDADHRVRPYAVVRKESDFLYAYQGTSNQNYVPSGLSYPLKQGEYNLWKDGILALNDMKKLPASHVIRIMDHLSITDQLQINSRLSSAKLSPAYFFRFLLTVEYQPHTVVRKEKSFYYVWHVQGTGMTLLRLNSTGNIPVNYKGKLYYVSPKTAVPAGTGEGYLPAGSLTGSIRKELARFELPPQRIKSEQPGRANDDFASAHEFEYPAGTLLFNGERNYIYLFSSHGRRYGMDLMQSAEPIPVLRRITGNTPLRHSGTVPASELKEITDRLAAYDRKCAWLCQPA